MKKRLFQKKEKTTSESVPKDRRIRTKTMRRVVWLGIILLSISGVFAFLQTQGLRIKVSSINKEVISIQEKDKKNANESVVLTPEVESFMNRFVALYMAITEDSETQKLRQETLLKEYYAQGIKEADYHFSGKRTLKSAAFISLKKKDGTPTASYKVSYVIETKGEDDQKKEGAVTQILNIPFQTSKKGSRVISYPYFTAIKENKEKAKILGFDQNSYDSLDAQTRSKAMSFIEDFLEKYAKNSAEDMRYMMDDPEGLQGTAVVDQVNGRAFKGKKSIVIKATVKFKDKGTDLIWQENMTFDVIKKSDKYYVKKLTHTW